MYEKALEFSWAPSNLVQLRIDYMKVLDDLEEKEGLCKQVDLVSNEPLSKEQKQIFEVLKKKCKSS
jgi:hypothetical protein